MLYKIINILLIFYFLAFGNVIPEISRAEDVYNVAVLDLVSNGVSQVVASGLSERLRTHISRIIRSDEYRESEKYVRYEMMERTQIDKVFEQYDLQNIGCVSDSCAIEFGKMLQVNRIIIGSVSLIGQTYTVTSRIVDVGTGKTIRIADKDYRGPIDDVVSSVILEVGDELLLGPKKKSRLKWYILGGALIGGGVAAKILMTQSDDMGTIIINVPLPE